MVYKLAKKLLGSDIFYYKKEGKCYKAKWNHYGGVITHMYENYDDLFAMPYDSDFGIPNIFSLIWFWFSVTLITEEEYLKFAEESRPEGYQEFLDKYLNPEYIVFENGDNKDLYKVKNVKMSDNRIRLDVILCKTGLELPLHFEINGNPMEVIPTLYSIPTEQEVKVMLTEIKLNYEKVLQEFEHEMIGSGRYCLGSYFCYNGTSFYERNKTVRKTKLLNKYIIKVEENQKYNTDNLIVEYLEIDGDQEHKETYTWNRYVSEFKYYDELFEKF